MGTRWGVVADPAESVGVGILMVQRHQFTAASAESVGSQALISLALASAELDTTVVNQMI